MNISIEELAKPVRSYSRTGRMAEAFQTKHTSISNREKGTNQGLKLDMSKMLSVAEVGDDGGDGAEDPSPDDELLCSSAREHPSVSKKSNYIVTAEKEIAFAETMKQLIGVTDSVLHQRQDLKIGLGADDDRPESRATMKDGKPTASSPAAPGSPTAAAGGQQKQKQVADLVEDRIKQIRDKIKKEERAKKRRLQPSPCFKTTTRSQRAQEKKPKRNDRGTPPVGHYHPRFDVVEQPCHKNVYFPKASRKLGGPNDGNESPGRGGCGERGDRDDDDSNCEATASFNKTMTSNASFTHTTSGAFNATVSMAASPSSAAGRAKASTPGPGGATGAGDRLKNSKSPALGVDGTTSPPRASTSMNKPTWPFLSKDSHAAPKRGVTKKAGTSELQDVVMNRDLIENRQHTIKAFDMGKVVGRAKAQATQSQDKMLDLFYNPKLEKFHSPAMSFDKQVSRFQEERQPRTAKEVETAHSRIDIRKHDKFKFARQPMLCDLKKVTSRDAATNSTITLQMNSTVGASELSTAPVHIPEFRTPGFRMKQMAGRKGEKPKPANDAQYEVDYSQVDKHNPDTKITATPNRPMPGQKLCETVQIDVGCYQTDTPLVHRKITHNVSIDRSVSRDRRERVTTVGLSGGKAQTEVYDVRHTLQDKRISGNPMISSHMSRDKRMQVQSPTPGLTDKVYTYEVDKLYPPLRKGAVAFEKQVVREKHAGSHFANASKEMVDPSAKE